MYVELIGPVGCTIFQKTGKIDLRKKVMSSNGTQSDKICLRITRLAILVSYFPGKSFEGFLLACDSSKDPIFALNLKRDHTWSSYPLMTTPSRLTTLRQYSQTKKMESRAAMCRKKI